MRNNNIIILLLCFWCVSRVISATGLQQALPHTCASRVYCQGPLLETVQLAKIFHDSKTFVDMRMIYTESTTLRDFDKLMSRTKGSPTLDQLTDFVLTHFESGNELENSTLDDWTEHPKFLDNIQDPILKQFGSELNKIWPSLARRIRDSVKDNPSQYSIEPIPNIFVIPGGRFKEPYYWDSYWIVSGLLICDMKDTARGVIENLLWMVNKYGFVPNGGRVYYAERSQPPLLARMAYLYMKYTNDIDWLRKHVRTLEKELKYWLKVHAVEIQGNILMRYYAPSEGPRPESYREDYLTASQNQAIYTELKSGAESGWDFSSRWFPDNTESTLDNIRTTDVVPVDLNGFYCGAVGHLIDFYDLLGEEGKAAEWGKVRDDLQEAIYNVLWNEDEGIWYDLNITSQAQRKVFYPSNITPLWTKCISSSQNLIEVGDRVANYLVNSDMFFYPGGVPTSLNSSGEQWDFPNAWPPMQGIIAEALFYSGSELAEKLALNITHRWVNSNLRGYRIKHEMYEKYDCQVPGRYGGGGEYDVQAGFGWTNGVILEMLDRNGDVLKFDPKYGESIPFE